MITTVSIRHKASPCKGCDKRCLACHDTCEEYKAWKAEREKLNNIVFQESTSERLNRAQAELPKTAKEYQSMEAARKREQRSEKYFARKENNK